MRERQTTARGQPRGRVRNRFENATWLVGLDLFLSGWSNSVLMAMFRVVHKLTWMHAQVKVLRSESAYHAVGSWW